MSAYSSNVPATSEVYTNSVPAVLLGILRGSSELATLWFRFSTGEVFSAEWVADSSTPVGFLYDPSAVLCWRVPYSASSGYGSWEQSSTGPLGTSCAAVSNAAWYTQAVSMSDGATYTGASTISSGYIGIQHMMHQVANNIVVGGELDGRTLSAELNKGKPAQGEVYVISTSNSVETLVATTEASAQTQLLSASAVDPSSVGGLTAGSSIALKAELGAFSSIWLHSESVASAESHGLVSQRCPSDTSAAYIAIGCSTARDSGISLDPSRSGSGKQAISLQRLSMPESNVQLLLVCSNIDPLYLV